MALIRHGMRCPGEPEMNKGRVKTDGKRSGGERGGSADLKGQMMKSNKISCIREGESNLKGKDVGGMKLQSQKGNVGRGGLPSES